MTYGLKNCVKKNAAVLLLAKAERESFYIMWPDKIKLMLGNKPYEIYDGFSPNDIAVRVYADEFDKYLKK